MRLLILIAIVYLVYRAGKAWLVKTLQTPNQPTGRGTTVDDVMIQDPVCGIHFPRREGVTLEHEGKTLLFCSAACRDRFIEDHPPRS